MEGTVSIEDFMKHLEDNGYVITHRSEAKKESLRRGYLRRNSLSYKEVSEAGFWGDIGKKAVEAISKKELLPHEKFKDGNKWKIRRSAVERISRNRGMWSDRN